MTLRRAARPKPLDRRLHRRQSPHLLALVQTLGRWVSMDYIHLLPEDCARSYIRLRTLVYLASVDDLRQRRCIDYDLNCKMILADFELH